MATKKNVKAQLKKAAKKPAAKKLVKAKKPAAKKALTVKKPAAKKPVNKKPVAKKKPVAQKVEVETVEPKKTARVAPRILKRTASALKSPAEYKPVDTEKAVAFAMSIAEQMKLRAAKADQKNAEAEIRLSRRPTTRKQGSNTVKFPVSDLKEFKKRLMEARIAATSGVNAMKATGFNEADDHEADGGDGTAQTLRLQALGQMGSINRVIQQIDEALHRIEDGTYGVCTSCGQLIRKPRLLNQPFVLTCMECQQEVERGAK